MAARNSNERSDLAVRRRARLRFGYVFALWAAFFLFCGRLSAGAQYRFDVWTADRGLPENIITQIRQTSDGYLWLATLDGLVRFDGVRFTTFDRSNSQGIASNRFSSLYEGVGGDFWLGTEGSGITHLKDGVFTTYTTQQGLPTNTVRAVIGDRAGNVWALSDGKILHWDSAVSRFVLVGPVNGNSHFDALIWDIGGFWQAQGDRLTCFQQGSFRQYRLPPWMLGRSVTWAALDQQGAMWLSAKDGTRAVLRDGSAERLPANPAQVSLSYRDSRGRQWALSVGKGLNRSVSASASGVQAAITFSTLYADREGELWLATNGQGLYRLRRNFITALSTEQGLIDKDVYPIYQDQSGAVWIGAWPGGLSRYYSGRFTSFTTRDGLSSGLITSITQDKDGRLWVAAHGGVRVFVQGRFQELPGLALPDRAVVQAIHQDPTGTMWLGTSHGLLQYRGASSHLFTTLDGLAGNDVRVIVDGPSGELWVGGFGGLSRLSGGRLQHWTERDGLPSNAIRAIYRESDGVLWLGTYDGGLARFANGRFTRYTKRDGLFSNGVFQILEDARGDFWMSSNQGISRVSKRELDDFATGKRQTIDAIAYGRIDGMLNVECNGGLWPAGIKARDGSLWFPTQDGVAVVNPAAAPYNPLPPPVLIETLLVDHRTVRFDRPVQIAPGNQNFEVQYSALSLINSEQIRFRYLLQGVDTDWVDAGQRRTAYYSHVPPGHYLFRVIASNSDGVWNRTGESLSIVVLAPFYRTWWFEFVAFACCAFAFWYAWRLRVAKLERAQAVQQAFSLQLIASQESERKRIAAELHDSLGQRLVVVKNLALLLLRSQQSRSGDGQLETIEEISSEASLAINETREISYNLRPFQLDRLGLRKAVEGLVRTVSSASGIGFKTEVDNIDEVFPEERRINFYRIVQECLQNIVKHSGATEASVRVKLGKDGVSLSIVDNGRGLAPGDRAPKPGMGGFGLTGMEERARLLGGTFHISSVPGGGTTVTVAFHLKSHSHA